MIGRLKGTLIHKQPPWVKRRVGEPLARAPLNARELCSRAGGMHS
jgi:hypothetical protein